VMLRPHRIPPLSLCVCTHADLRVAAMRLLEWNCLALSGRKASPAGVQITLRDGCRRLACRSDIGVMPL